MRRFLPPLLVFVLTVAALLPSALSLPQHGDESRYIWRADYYTTHLLALDFAPRSRSHTDPGFDPTAYWAIGQPMGCSLLYGFPMQAIGLRGPTLPYEYDTGTQQGPETDIPSATLLFTRLIAIISAGIGLALIVYRFEWRAFIAAMLFLAIPHVRGDLARAWAEGPLLLGFGLCAASHGTRWFGIGAGLAASFKLTALGLWFLLLIPLRTWTRPCVLALILAVVTWTLTNPVSWFHWGILHLGPLMAYRVLAYVSQSTHLTSTALGGFFLPTRYLWPIELATLLGVCLLLPRLYHHYSTATSAVWPCSYPTRGRSSNTRAAMLRAVSNGLDNPPSWFKVLLVAIVTAGVFWDL